MEEVEEEPPRIGVPGLLALQIGVPFLIWNLMELWVCRPILIQDKQQFMCSTKSICRDKNTPPLRNNVVDGISEALFSDMAGLVLLHAIS